MSELTHVINSTGLESVSGAVSKVCPRELLGLACIRDNYSCLCEQVESCQIETVKGQGGEAAVVNLRMTLIPHVGLPRAVMTGIDLTGYKADFEAGRNAVRASFNLRRPQNTELRSFIRETHLRTHSGMPESQ